MRFLSNFVEIEDDYDGFILDLWGVIHDGVRPYPGAVGCLTRLRDAGKRVVLLSNAPRRAEAAQLGLRAMGIADNLYTDIMTSGEATHILLRDRADAWFAALGVKVFHLGPERDRNVIAGLDLVLVDQPKDADFVLNTGPDDAGGPTELGDWDDVLRSFHDARLPMICSNPDLEVMRGSTRLLCAGALAQKYEEIGGQARWIGKPDPAIYTPVLRMLDLPVDRVLAVGDTLRTDIAGAVGVNIDSCWVLGGIHAGDFASNAAAELHARRVGIVPNMVVQNFS